MDRAVIGHRSQLIQSKIVTVDSPIAQALGATPLKPETSYNYSFGFTVNPSRRLTLSVDAYEIDVNNRVSLTGLLSGTKVSNILVANGFSASQYVRFFTNAINTRTRGIDVVGSYTFPEFALGQFKGTVGYNHNVTNIMHIADNPAALAGTGLTLFDRQTQGYMTAYSPKDKLILGVDWKKGRLSANVKETRYGSWALLGTSAATDQFYRAKWITDAEVGFDVTPRVRVVMGAQNVFNTYPDRNTVSSTIGSSPYGQNSPFGAYGGFYYGRLQIKL